MKDTIFLLCSSGEKMKNELELFKRSKGFLWTDKHIANNMLSAHLDQSNDVASRNGETIDKTVDWINREIRQNSKIIDLGCGPGLYAQRLSSLGHFVTGIDISKNSIKYAKKTAKNKNLPIKYSVGNYLKKGVMETTDVALCIYCDFGALIPEEQDIFLKNVHDSLDSEGILFFDVFTEKFSNTKQEERNWYITTTEDFWNKKPHYILSESVHFKDNNCWGSRTIIIDKKSGKENEFITWDQYYTESEITEKLSNNGFKVEKIEKTLIQKNEFTSNEVMFVKAIKI